MTIEIGAKIKQLRTARSMTQEQLGTALGISAQAISKWESGSTMPDIQLLPELSVIFGVSIDELFDLTDDSRMARIDNMIEAVRFIPESEFQDAERYLKEKTLSDKTKPRATLLLASLYVKRAQEYNAMASPLAREALLLNPDEKLAHNAVFNAEDGSYWDWNVTNRWELIDFYKDFLKLHPENPRSYMWLMDLLVHDGRTRETREYLEAMDRIEHSFRTDMYRGFIARAEGDLPAAMAHWRHMTEEFPDNWLSWSCLADRLAEHCRYDEAMACYQKAMELQPSPKFMDNPEAMSQIAEIQGDYEKAVSMREICIEICRRDWNLTEGEWVDMHRREIVRLREKMAKQK